MTEEIIFVPCSHCISKTKHKVLHSVSRQDTDDTNDWYGLVECGGCGTISMAHQSRWLGDGSVTNTYYPPPMSRKLPNWASLMLLYAEREEPLVYDFLTEIHQALQGNMTRLAAMGVRSLLECDGR